MIKQTTPPTQSISIQSITEIIQCIHSIIGDRSDSTLRIQFGDPNWNEITFEVYAVKVPIIVSKEVRYAYVDTSVYSWRLDPDMLIELAEITKLLTDNIDVVLESLSSLNGLGSVER